jgi:hypothetical protein
MQLALGKPGGTALFVHAARQVDLKKGETPAELKLTLRRGVTIRAKVLDPGGKPVKQAELYCLQNLQDRVALPVREGQLVLPGCDPKETLTAFILDGANRHGATVRLTAGKDDRPTARLVPCGTARLRYVDDKGKPLSGLSGGLHLVLDSKTHAVLSHLMPGRQLPGTDGHSDKDGLLNVALIPGATYRYFDDKGMHEFEARSGKDHKLPDMVYKMPRK